MRRVPGSGGRNIFPIRSRKHRKVLTLQAGIFPLPLTEKTIFLTKREKNDGHQVPTDRHEFSPVRHMGRLAYLARSVSGRRVALQRRGDRQYLRHHRDRLAVHARSGGHRGRPLDPGAEIAGYLPSAGLVPDAGGRAAATVRSAVRRDVVQRAVLHAHDLPVVFPVVFLAGTGGAGYRAAFSAHPYLGNHRFYLLDDPGGPVGTGPFGGTAVHVGRYRVCVGGLRLYPAELSGQ